MLAILKKINIRNKMLIAYVAPAAIYLGLPILVYQTTTQVLGSFQEVERIENVIGLTNNISAGTEQMVRGLRGYLINQNPLFLKDFKTGAELARQSGNNVEPIIKNPQQKTRLQKMLSLSNEYYNNSNEIVNLLQANKKTEALAIFNTGKHTKFVNEFVETHRQFSELESDLIRVC